MFCSKCGIEIQDGMKFCPKCGAQLVLTSVEQKSADLTTEMQTEKKTGTGMPITEDAVRRYASTMKATKNVTIISPGTKVHGATLAAGEIPLVLFGVNSVIGKLSMFGWCGVMFTNQAIHYKIQKATSAMLKVVRGVVKYESIRTLGLVKVEGENAYLLKINDRTIAQYVTGIEKTSGTCPIADSDSAAALAVFCNAMTPAPIGTLRCDDIIPANVNRKNSLATALTCLGWLLILAGVADFLLGNLGIMDLTGVSWSPIAFCGVGSALQWKARQLRINETI